MRRKFNPPEPPRPQPGAIMEDIYSRLWAVLAAGPCNISVRQIVHGEILKTTVTLDLATVRNTGRRINIYEENQ